MRYEKMTDTAIVFVWRAVDSRASRAGSGVHMPRRDAAAASLPSDVLIDRHVPDEIISVIRSVESPRPLYTPNFDEQAPRRL